MAGAGERGPGGGPGDGRRPLERPPIGLLNEWRWAWWLPVGLVVARVLAVIGLHPYLYVDSAEYGTLDLTGRGRRPWATPALYWAIPGDRRWELVGQAVVGGLCWSVLALAVAAWFRDRRVGLVAAGAVVALALTTSLTNWDTAILSESLALSLTALLVAAWLNLLRRPSWATVALVALATFPWLFVRQSLLPTAWAVAAATVVAAIASWRLGTGERAAQRQGRAIGARHLGALAAALVLLTGLATASYARNQEVVRTNLTVIVANRVATDGDRLDWFRDHGMPVPPSGDLGPGALAVDPAFARWVAGEGRGTYTRFLVTHPWYALTEPLDDLVGVRRSYGDEPEPTAAMLSPADAYGSARPVVPEPLEEVLFDPGATGTVTTVLVLTLVWSVVRRRRRDARWALPLGLVALSVGSMLVGWHGATPELGRLAIVAAVALRIGLLLQIGLLVDGH
ncbi:MAG TPA: hypothetical protein VHK88_08480, partial [Aquihabitans sp.]|nr:hypothetical protein [Aquihabitans sp.]